MCRSSRELSQRILVVSSVFQVCFGSVETSIVGLNACFSLAINLQIEACLLDKHCSLLRRLDIES